MNVLTLVLAGILTMALDAQHHERARTGTPGEQAMGFDQARTTHHFHLYADGGAIDVAANRADDTASVAAIRLHLRRIAVLFAEGNFAIPGVVHDTVVPGTADLSRLKALVTYRFAETPGGGRVLIVTEDAEALKAVHTFLRFQITDHGTSDPLNVTPR